MCVSAGKGCAVNISSIFTLAVCVYMYVCLCGDSGELI